MTTDEREAVLDCSFPNCNCTEENCNGGVGYCCYDCRRQPGYESLREEERLRSLDEAESAE